MKLKKSLSLLSPILILFGSTALFSKLIIDDPQSKIIASESSSAIEFVDEMNDIYAAPNVDYDGEVVDYFSANKQYELQNDVDFAGVENLYDGTMNVSLINNSSFNGNGYSIQNRWDSDQFEAYFNSASSSRGSKWMNDFDESYVSSSIPIYLFNPFQNVDVYNLTFDNSPFAFAASTSSTFVNVNMNNIDIENVDLTFEWSGVFRTKDINSFNMALFMYQTDMDFVWKNSSINNVTIANNTFDFSSASPTVDAPGGFPYDVDVKIGLIGKSQKGAPISNMILQDLELQNWNISNNQIKVKNYSEGTYINDPNLKITPFVMDSGTIANSNFIPTESHYSEISSQDPSSRVTAEDDINISKIYLQNWTINDNTFSDESNSYSSVNFSVGPNIINDNVLNINFSSIYLDNIQSNQEVIGDSYYTDGSTNTIISFADNYILESSEVVSLALGNTFNSSSTDLLADPIYKESVFNTQFWDTQSENLALKSSSSINFDSEVKYDASATPEPYFSFDLQPNNFWVEQLSVNLVDQTQQNVYSNSISNNQDLATWTDSNMIFNLKLSTIFNSIHLEATNSYTLNINFSEYNPIYQYSFFINPSDDYLVYNFEDTYQDGTFSYSFDYIDPYNEITSFDLSLYNKNKLVFEDSIPTSSFEQYSLNSSTISNSRDINIKNQGNYYFVFEVNTLNSQGSYTTSLLPQEMSETASFVLGDETYISDFKTSPNTWLYYYWWVILVTIAAILIILVISGLGYLYLKANKNKRNVETKIKEYAEEHGIALSTFYEDSNYYEPDYYSNDFDQDYEYDYSNEDYQNNYQEEANPFENVNPSENEDHFLNSFFEDDSYDGFYNDYQEEEY